MLQELLAAVLAFVSTNIDDLFILMALFLSATIKPRNIVIGQYLGIITLIVLSLAGALLGIVIPGPYIGLLGLFPIYIGIKNLWQQHTGKHDDDEADETAKVRAAQGTFAQIMSVTSLTVANGGDNVGIYIPFFAAKKYQEIILIVIAFLMLTAVWIITARYFTTHPVLAQKLQRVIPTLFPFLLIGLGVYILYGAGSFQLLF